MKQWANAYRDKVILPEKLEGFASSLRTQNKTIATVNGSFDLLHAGHLQIIYEASQLADILIVLLNSDHSIKQYKSSDRPIIPLEYRMQMMTALEFVDYVTWFEETDPIQALEKIKPTIHINGPDWGKDCIEAETVKSNGGSIHIAQFVPGLSTSNILEKINSLRENDASHSHLS